MTSSRMPVQNSNLFLLDDLTDVNKTNKLAEGDLTALHALAEWISSFVTRPHKDLGRAGPVCPFVPDALKYKTLWLAPERIEGKHASDVIQLANKYKKLLLDVQPVDGDAAGYKSIIVVFPDLSVARARALFDEVFQNLAIPSYAEAGFVMGGFYDTNEGTALYNSSFHPFQSPAAFLLIRRAVISDWKFFLNNEEMLNLWARRYGESGALVLAQELRNLPWNATRH
jgi:Domain of unknown function (DUF6875)